MSADKDPNLLQEMKTSPWYEGKGKLSSNKKQFSFEITASFTLKSKITILEDIFNPKNAILANSYINHKRCIGLIDENVDKIYGQKIRLYFQSFSIDTHFKSLRCLEVDKNIKNVTEILKFIGKKCNVSRNEPVLVIGGGVMSDMAGLACSLLNRRTGYIMIPTTLVAAIDAGPSPRTCVNGDQFKNSIGSYHPPILSIVDPVFFQTLTIPHIRNGLAEIIKIAIMTNEKLYKQITKYGQQLLESKFSTNTKIKNQNTVTKNILYSSLYSYMEHEGTNIFETHQMRPHAFGHTWSPKFELISGLMHGQAVSVDMALGASIACEMNLLSKSVRDHFLELLHTLGLCIYHPVISDVDMMKKAQTNMIKKRGNRGLWAPLPTAIGKCTYIKNLTFDLLEQSLMKHEKLCSSFKNKGMGLDIYN